MLGLLKQISGYNHLTFWINLPLRKTKIYKVKLESLTLDFKLKIVYDK